MSEDKNDKVPTFEISNMGPSIPAEKRPTEFDNVTEACPHCGAKNFAKILGVLYSYPKTMKFKCLFCHKTYSKTFGCIRILRGEEAVRKRPKMYIGHPEWGELAERLLREREEWHED